jgi:predicted DNA-binding protein
MTLRLPNELDEKLETAIIKGNAIAKTELIRRAIGEFIENHPDMFI